MQTATTLKWKDFPDIFQSWFTKKFTGNLPLFIYFVCSVKQRVSENLSQKITKIKRCESCLVYNKELPGNQKVAEKKDVEKLPNKS